MRRGSWLFGYKLSKGVLCADCRRKCTQYLSDPGYLSVEDIKRNMEARTANQALYAFFNVGDTLYVDFQNQLWYLGYETESKQAYIFHFEELIDYQFGKKIPRNNIDRATRDGFLFGKMGLWERKGSIAIFRSFDGKERMERPFNHQYRPQHNPKRHLGI